MGRKDAACFFIFFFLTRKEGVRTVTLPTREGAHASGRE
jgi:hypothetical protein